MNHETIEAAELSCAMGPRPFSPEEQRVGLGLLRELTRGMPVGASRLALVLGTARAQVEALLEDSALTPFVQATPDGRVEGFLGLTTNRTLHRFVLEGRPRWTWCAFDGLVLPGLLDETARIESADPETGDPVRVTVSPAKVEAATPAPLKVHVSVVCGDTCEGSSANRIIATRCRYMHFFGDRGSGESWVARHPQAVLLSLGQAFELGRRCNARLFGHALALRARREPHPAHADDALER